MLGSLGTWRPGHVQECDTIRDVHIESASRLQSVDDSARVLLVLSVVAQPGEGEERVGEVTCEVRVELLY